MMEPRKIARLRRLVEAPSYPYRRLERLEAQYGVYSGACSVGRDAEFTCKAEERTSRKIERMLKIIHEMEQEEERERIHRKYEKSLP